MALGDQARALRIANMTAGMSDPTKIYDDGRVVGDVGRFDRAPDRVTHKTTGTLPGGVSDVFPVERPAVPAGPVDIFAGALPFRVPDATRETVSRGAGTVLPVNDVSALFSKEGR